MASCRFKALFQTAAKRCKTLASNLDYLHELSIDPVSGVIATVPMRTLLPKPAVTNLEGSVPLAGAVGDAAQPARQAISALGNILCGIRCLIFEFISALSWFLNKTTRATSRLFSGK